MTANHHKNVLVVAVAVAVVSLAVALVAVAVYSKHLSTVRRNEQIAGCERANQQRRYINALLVHHPGVGLAPIKIPDCGSIIK